MGARVGTRVGGIIVRTGVGDQSGVGVIVGVLVGVGLAGVDVGRRVATAPCCVAT